MEPEEIINPVNGLNILIYKMSDGKFFATAGVSVYSSLTIHSNKKTFETKEAALLNMIYQLDASSKSKNEGDKQC